MEWISTSPEETKRIAEEILASLKPQERATVVALKGNLGAGKTTFTQCIAGALDVTEHVTSPTFVIEKVYELSDKSFKYLIHIDAYRLEGGHELEVLGWNTILKDPTNLILIEWPEKVQEIIPPDAVTIEFEHVDEHTRRIKK